MMVIRPRLEALVKALQGLGELTVVAPETNHSGASNSLTLNRPLSVRTASNGFIAVNGTPSDCVHVALTGLMDARPDLVVSGINNGANMGDDTLYSGTVAAASEGYLFGIPRSPSRSPRRAGSTSNRRPAPRARWSNAIWCSRWRRRCCSTSISPTAVSRICMASR